MNNRKKGRQAENKVADIFLKDNYQVHKSSTIGIPVQRDGKRIFIYKNNDIFGLFDLVARKSLSTDWIQVKTNINDVYGAKKEIDSFLLTKYESAQIWLKIDRVGYVVWIKNKNKDWKKIFKNLKGNLCEPFVYS